MIRIENISKVFNPRSRNRNQVLKNISFELPEKGLIAIFGKSGSGKTTLLNIIGGLDKQDGGKIYIDGENVAGKVDRTRNAKIGYIFQNYYLEKGYTITEILRNQMTIAGFKDENEIKRRTTAALELVEMERFKNKRADALSGGQQQRVAIARAIVKGSDIILADEPTGNLDAENTVKVMEILKEISKTQLVVLVTHEVTLIKNYADSHIKIVDGKLVPDSDVGDEIKYVTEHNAIRVDGSKAEKISKNGVDIEFYGAPSQSGECVKIVNDNGTIYIQPGRNVTVLDGTSEKKLVFKGAEEEKAEKARNAETIASAFTKSNAKKNGKLFTFKSILKLFKKGGEERAYSTANIVKQIFIAAMAAVICFFAFSAFEVLNTEIENKTVDENGVYTNLDAYSEIRRLNADLYDGIDFFDTQLKSGTFAYSDFVSLSEIRIDYTPKALNDEVSFDLYGRMPAEGEVLISRSIAEKIKERIRLSELQNDRSMQLLTFENEYRVSGIVEIGLPLVYMNKSDYVIS